MLVLKDLLIFFACMAIIICAVLACALNQPKQQQVNFSVEMPQNNAMFCQITTYKPIDILVDFSGKTEMLSLPYTYNGSAPEGTEITLNVAYYNTTKTSNQLNGANITQTTNPKYFFIDTQTYTFTVTNQTLTLEIP